MAYELSENEKWHLAWNGPRVVLVHMPNVVAGKSVVEFHNAVEIVDTRDLYDSEEACQTAAWLRKMQEAQGCIEMAARYKSRADLIRKEKGELP